MSKRIRAGLSGPNAELGKVPAADVAHFLLGLERTAARAAMTLLGKTGGVGRRGRVVENAVRLKLHSVSPGSIIAELEVPDVQFEDPDLGLDVQTLGDQAIEKTIATAKAEDGANPEIAEALVSMLNELGVGERYESAWLEPVGQPGQRVVIDGDARLRLGIIAANLPTLPREDRVVGTLVEADFEKRTARLRTPDGKAVLVQFGDDVADEIQHALRKPAEFEGRVSFDPRTSFATSVEVRQVTRADQLALGLQSDAFWNDPTMDELIRDRGARAIEDFSLVKDESATPDEIDAFMAALEE